MVEKKDIGKLFDGIAGTYDRFNHLLSLNVDKVWRRKAVQSLRRGDKVLDVATGTADLALEIIRQEKAGEVTGIDISSGMMEIGRKKVEKKGLSGRIVLSEGSALDIPFPDGFFDAVTCAYGVRNFSNPDKGLKEMYRVLRSGGQLAILEFSYPSGKVTGKMYDIFFTRLMPVVGKAISRDKKAYVYFRDSVKGFVWGEKMAARIGAAGFVDVRFRPMTFGISTLYTANKL